MKTVKRLLPSSKYDIPALEAWFTAQSEKGLFLQSVGLFFATFQEGTPQRKTYRLEVVTGMDIIPEKEMIETYATFGWEYVTCISNFFHVYAHEGDAELHSDPLVQSLTLEKTEKRLKGSLQTTFVVPIYALISYGSLAHSGELTLTNIVRYNLIPYFLALFFFFLLSFLQALLPYLQIRRQRKILQNGSFPERSAKVRRLHSGYCGVGLLLCVIYMLVFTATGLKTIVSAEETMHHWQKTPVVTLEEIEGLPPKDYTAMTQEEYLNFDNLTYFEEHSLLDPHQFTLRQDTKIPVEEGENHSTYRLTAYLGMHYDAVAFSFLA